MKKMYHLGDDLFIACAFVSFLVGGMLKLLGITTIFWNVTVNSVVSLSVICLLFSIALSLYDVAHGEKQ